MGRNRRRILFRLTIVVFFSAAVAGWQVHNPARIGWAPASLNGCPASKAGGLVLQHESGDSVWASLGYDIYRSTAGGPFERVASLRPPFGEPWGGYSRALRKAYGYQELVEVVPLRSDLLLVFGGGGVYRIDLTRGTQEQVLALRYFGRGAGRGVMSRIAVDDAGDVFFGEYSTLPAPHTVRILRGTDEARTWTTTYEFASGDAAHVHGLQWDPYARLLWVMTGDADTQSRIGFSRDRGEHFEWIGQGDQLHRACSLMFTPDAVLWATDTEANRLVGWSRSTRETSVLTDLPAQSLYAAPLDAHRSLMSQSAWDAAAYVVGDEGELHAIARFSPEPQRGQPIPGVRLARGSGDKAKWALFNPLRTIEDEAAIYRVSLDDLSSCAPPPARAVRRP